MSSGRTNNLYGVWGSGSNVFAVGSVGTILHYDGTPITARFIAGAIRKNMVWHKEYA